MTMENDAKLCLIGRIASVTRVANDHGIDEFRVLLESTQGPLGVYLPHDRFVESFGHLEDLDTEHAFKLFFEQNMNDNLSVAYLELVGTEKMNELFDDVLSNSLEQPASQETGIMLDDPSLSKPVENTEKPQESEQDAVPETDENKALDIHNTDSVQTQSDAIQDPVKLENTTNPKMEPGSEELNSYLKDTGEKPDAVKVDVDQFKAPYIDPDGIDFSFKSHRSSKQDTEKPSEEDLGQKSNIETENDQEEQEEEQFQESGQELDM